MSTKKWDAVDGVLASTAANWTGGLPIVGDNIEFDADSAAHNCTWDLALALGSFTMTADYSGTITQAASFSVTSYSQAGGTFTGNTGFTLTDSGNFNGSPTIDTVNLIMNGAGTTITFTSRFHSLTINAAVTATTTFETINFTTGTAGVFTIANGVAITVKPLILFSWTTWTNAGSITRIGDGTLNIVFYDADRTLALGIINCPLRIYALVSAESSLTLTLSASVVLGSTLLVNSDHATNTMTLDLSALNCTLSATDITIGTRGIINGRGSVITCNGTFDSSAGAFTQGTSTLIMGATGNLKCAADGAYNLRVAEGVTTTLTAALNVYKDLRVVGTLTRGANTVSLLGAGEQTVSGYPDTAITVNSTGPVIFLDCAHHPIDTTFTAGACVWIRLPGYSSYYTYGNLSISAVSRKPTAFQDIDNGSGTLTLDVETRCKDLKTSAGATTVQSAGVQLGISGKINTIGTLTINTASKIERGIRAFGFPFAVCLRPVNQVKGWGDA